MSTDATKIQPGMLARIERDIAPFFARDIAHDPGLVYGQQIRWVKPGFIAFRRGTSGIVHWWSEGFFQIAIPVQ